MCNRYEFPDVWEIERHWHIGRRTSEDWARQMAPLYKGPYLRAWDGEGLALEAGQWGMIPPGSEERIPRMKPKAGQKQGKRLSTNNARAERLDSAWTFKYSWTDGRRCLIPAVSFDEPNWESGKNEWWRFRRADRELWALAGLWSEWKDPQTGEIVPNFTMITINADAHPLMKRMHRPEVDPKTKQVLPIDKQDKRSVVAIERENWDQWLKGTVEEARALLQPRRSNTSPLGRPSPSKPRWSELPRPPILPAESWTTGWRERWAKSLARPTAPSGRTSIACRSARPSMSRRWGKTFRWCAVVVGRPGGRPPEGRAGWVKGSTPCEAMGRAARYGSDVQDEPGRDWAGAGVIRIRRTL